MPGSVLPQALGSKVEIADPNSKLTASDAKHTTIFNQLLLNREIDLHSDYLPGMKAHPVKYLDANGKVETYSFTNPPHP